MLIKSMLHSQLAILHNTSSVRKFDKIVRRGSKRQASRRPGEQRRRPRPRLHERARDARVVEGGPVERDGRAASSAEAEGGDGGLGRPGSMRARVPVPPLRTARASESEISSELCLAEAEGRTGEPDVVVTFRTPEPVSDRNQEPDRNRIYN